MGADHSFAISAASVSPFDSHVGTLALFDLLVATTAERLKESAADGLQRVESGLGRSVLAHRSLTMLLTRGPWQYFVMTELRRCRWCRRALPERGGRGRPREFCSARCRQWDWVARQRARELELSDGELVIAKAALDELHDDLYVLACAVDDVERDLAAGPTEARRRPPSPRLAPRRRPSTAQPRTHALNHPSVRGPCECWTIALSVRTSSHSTAPNTRMGNAHNHRYVRLRGISRAGDGGAARALTWGDPDVHA